GGIGRARLTTGQSGLTRSPVASSTGQTRSARFRPNLSMAGKRIEASDELASSSSRGSGQPHRGIRGRGRTQRRGRRGETVIVAAEGIFSEGLAARSPSGQSSSDLGKLRVKERCIRADPTETDEQALDYVMDDSKDVSDDEDVIPPEFVFLDNASAASSAKFEGISELLLKNAEDQLEDRLFLMRFPRALPYLLGWLKPFPEELRVSEEMDIRNADHPFVYLDIRCSDDEGGGAGGRRGGTGGGRGRAGGKDGDAGTGGGGGGGAAGDGADDTAGDGGNGAAGDGAGHDSDGSSDSDGECVRGYLNVHRSGKLSLDVETISKDLIRLNVESTPCTFPQKVYRVVVDESAEDEGVLSYLGETVEKLNCVPDGSSVKKVDYLKEM
ncbi:hypothetical protein M514_00119, partial [Trichuris suis]